MVGAEQIDHAFRYQQHILRAHATHTIRPVSRGSERREKQWRERDRPWLRKIFTMTEFAHEYDEFSWSWFPGRLEGLGVAWFDSVDVNRVGNFQVAFKCAQLPRHRHDEHEIIGRCILSRQQPPPFGVEYFCRGPSHERASATKASFAAFWA
jgi:hypothetical protein